MGLSKDKEREYARILYVSERLTAKDIAERVGVSEKTIGTWIDKYNWDKLRKSLLTTRQNQLVHWYNQLENINLDIETRPVRNYKKNGDPIIRVEPVGIPTGGEADIMSKIAANIQRLETEIGLGEYVEVSRKLLSFIQSVDLNNAKLFKNYIDEFINSKL